MRTQSGILLPLIAIGLFIHAQAQQPRKQQSSPTHAQQAQRPKAGDWLRKYKDVPPPEQEKALESDPNFKNLPKDRQDQLRQRLQQFDNLPPAGKARIINRMQAFDQLTPEQREEARELQQRFRDLPADRRQQVRVALRNLRGLGPEEREREMDTQRFHSMFNDNERDLMQKILELPTPTNSQPQQ